MTASSMVRLGGHKPLLTPPPPLAAYRWAHSPPPSRLAPPLLRQCHRRRPSGFRAWGWRRSCSPANLEKGSGRRGREDGRCAKLAVGTRNDREISV